MKKNKRKIKGSVVKCDADLESLKSDKIDIPSTSHSTLKKLLEIAKKK